MLKSTEKGSFVVNILDRQHSSWQGTITWLSDNSTKSFRSTMEMLFLIDGAMKEEAFDDTAEPPVLRKLPKITVCADAVENTIVKVK